MNKKLPLIFSFFAISHLFVACATPNLVSFKNEEKTQNNNPESQFLNPSLSRLLDSVYEVEPTANEFKTSQSYKTKQSQRTLEKNDLILKQLNLDTNKTLEELKYSFSFVNPAVFVNDRFYDSKLTIVFSKNNILRNFTKNWVFILQNIDKFYFVYNPYKGKYISFKDEDKDFNNTTNKFITFDSNNFQFYKFKQFPKSDYYTNEYVYYLVYDNNKIIKLWTFEKDNVILARLDFEVLVFDKPITSLGQFLSELEEESKNFEQNNLNKKIKAEQALLTPSESNPTYKPVLFDDRDNINTNKGSDGGDGNDSGSGTGSSSNNNSGSTNQKDTTKKDTNSSDSNEEDIKDEDIDDAFFDSKEWEEFTKNKDNLNSPDLQKKKIELYKKWKKEHPNGSNSDNQDTDISSEADSSTKSNNSQNSTENEEESSSSDQNNTDDDDDVFNPDSKLTLEEKLEKIKEQQTIEFNKQATQREKAKYDVFKDSYYLTLLSSLDSLEQKWSYKRFAFRDVVTSVIQLKRNVVNQPQNPTTEQIQQTTDFDKFINHNKDVLNKNETIEEKTTQNVYEVIKKAAYNQNNLAWETFLKTQEGKENEERILKELKELQKQLPKNIKNFSKEHKDIFDKLEKFYSDNWLFILQNLDKFQIKFSNWYYFPEQFNTVEKVKVHHSQKFLDELNSLDDAGDYYFVNNNLESIHVGDASVQSTTYKDFYIVKNNALINIKVVLNDGKSAVTFNPLIYYFPKARTKLSVKILTEIFHQALYHQIQRFYDAFENDFIHKHRYGFVAQMLLELKGDKNEN